MNKETCVLCLEEDVFVNPNWVCLECEAEMDEQKDDEYKGEENE